MNENSSNEALILRDALEAFERSSLIMAIDDPPTLGSGGDAGVTLWKGGQEWHFKMLLLPSMKKGDIGGIARSIGRDRKGLLIVTRYVPADVAILLRELRLGFIDTAGNASVDAAGLMLFLTGNKPTQKYPEVQVRRLFRPAGLKLLFALLSRPGLEREPYRAIAAASGSTLGTINWIFRDLAALGFMEEGESSGRHLVRRSDLLDQWATAYPQHLRPKQFVGTFRAERQEWWRDANLAQCDAQWGGEPAAARLTDVDIVAKITVYVRGPIDHLLRQHNLREDRLGDIEILTSFWTPMLTGNESVHPLIVYADLLAHPTDRTLEIAKRVYEKELGELLREQS